MTVALLCVDLTNDFIHPDGKLAERGYKDFNDKHDTLQRIARLQNHFRDQEHMVMHTRMAYSPGYWELNANSPLLNRVKKTEALEIGSWGAEFFSEVAPQNNEVVFTKFRVGAFHRTRLEIILRTQHIERLYICGLPTNISVESTAREAHDRDFITTVVSDACIARSEELHTNSINSIADFSTVKTTAEVLTQLASRKM